MKKYKSRLVLIDRYFSRIRPLHMHLTWADLKEVKTDWDLLKRNYQRSIRDDDLDGSWDFLVLSFTSGYEKTTPLFVKAGIFSSFFWRDEKLQTKGWGKSLGWWWLHADIFSNRIGKRVNEWKKERMNQPTNKHSKHNFNKKIITVLSMCRLKVYRYSGMLLDTGYIVHKEIMGGQIGPYAFSQAGVMWSDVKITCNGKMFSGALVTRTGSRPGIFLLRKKFAAWSKLLQGCWRMGEFLKSNSPTHIPNAPPKIPILEAGFSINFCSSCSFLFEIFILYHLEICSISHSYRNAFKSFFNFCCQSGELDFGRSGVRA